MQFQEKNFKKIEETFKEIRESLQKLLFSCETFDEARAVLKYKHRVEEDLAEKLRLAKDLSILERLELSK